MTKIIDYINEFPLPMSCVPLTLKSLLSQENIDIPDSKINVTTQFEKNQYKNGYEHLHMLMACVPEKDIQSLKVLSESTEGTVKSSTPICDEVGGIYPIKITVSGYDYIVASWGDGAHYSYNLAEKVWMTLGLSPRVVGNDEQKIIYDDLSLPIIGVSEGDVASEFEFNLKRDVYWTMRNDYLRKYLWMTGCYGVRVFFYESYLGDSPEVQQLLSGNSHYNKTLGNGWGELDIREVDGKLLLQLWASVAAISPILCSEQDIYSLIWPGDSQPITRKQARDIRSNKYAYLDDRFLEKYEKNKVFNAVPFKFYNNFSSCPSYKGQWGFRDCKRVGRNIIKVPFYELYRGVPDQEVYHAHQYAVSEKEFIARDSAEEHIVSKVDRLLLQLIELSENLPELVKAVNGEIILPSQFIEFNRDSYNSEVFGEFPIFQRMAQVAPLDMYQQDFLSRCKTLNEIIVRLKIGTLRKVLRALGANKDDISNLQGLKILQGILNILGHLNEQLEDESALADSAKMIDWKKINPTMAPLFVNNELRNAESHESIEEAIKVLEKLGFDTSTVSSGYGKALDFLLDGVIDSIKSINCNITDVLNRQVI